MKHLIIICLVLCVYSAQAQHYSSDPDLNQSLITLDANARLDFGAFRTDISMGYNISEKKIDYLSAEIGMSAGDIYLTAEIASLTHKSIDQVVAVYTVHKDKGWGVMAKELGIKPGSPEFHALKDNAKNNSKNKGKGNNKTKGKK